MQSFGTIPRSADIVGQGINALVALRPQIVAQFNNPNTRYSYIAAGLRAQFDLLISRLADEAVATRIAIAENDPLAALAASEYDTSVSSSQTSALGDIIVARSVGPLNAGVFRKGHRFRRPADVDAQPLSKNEIALTARQDTVLLQGSTLALIPVVASVGGTAGNYPLSSLGASTDFEAVDPFFDANLAITSGFIAGGQDEGIDDVLVRRVAAAQANGAYAPVSNALIAGALQVPGVRHCAVLDDVSRASSAIFVADASWAWSLSLAATVLSSLRTTPYEGFGCAIASRGIYNRWIHVVATVQVRHPSALADTTLLDAPIRSALLSYFDDRPDFFSWRRKAIQGVIARASREILTCTSVDVRDAITGASLTEPDTTGIGASAFLTHMMLGDNAVQITYQNAT